MMEIDRFEKTDIIIILILSFFVAIAQIEMKCEYDEIKLKRQLQYKALLENKDITDWQVAYRGKEVK